MAVTMKNVLFGDVTPCGSCKLVFLRSVPPLLVTPNVVPTSLSVSTLMMEAIRSSETSVLTRTVRRHIPECDIDEEENSVRLPLISARTEPTPLYKCRSLPLW
jgi:hypothetical protein